MNAATDELYCLLVPLADDRLLLPENDELRRKALRFLENKLADIKVVVPPDRVTKLQAVTIQLDLNYGKIGPMQYHPSAGWLQANGYATNLAKCVHLPRAADLLPAGRGPDLFAVAMLAPALAAAQEVELAMCDEASLASAFEAWGLDTELPSDAPERVWNWWNAWLDQPATWPVAVAALGRLLA